MISRINSILIFFPSLFQDFNSMPWKEVFTAIFPKDEVLTSNCCELLQSHEVFKKIQKITFSSKYFHIEMRLKDLSSGKLYLALSLLVYKSSLHTSAGDGKHRPSFLNPKCKPVNKVAVHVTLLNKQIYSSV